MPKMQQIPIHKGDLSNIETAKCHYSKATTKCLLTFGRSKGRILRFFLTFTIVSTGSWTCTQNSSRSHTRIDFPTKARKKTATSNSLSLPLHLYPRPPKSLRPPLQVTRAKTRLLLGRFLSSAENLVWLLRGVFARLKQISQSAAANLDIQADNYFFPKK